MALGAGYTADEGLAEPQKWRFRDISWRQVFARQDWANWCLTACVIVATAVVAGVAEPHQVPYVIWDARIAYPLNSEVDTIPAWAAVFAPIMMLLLTVLVGEFLTSRRQHASITQAVATAIYFFLDGVQAFVVSLLLTQVFKVMVGRLRPNFLARCQPAVPNDATIPLQNITQATLWQNQYPCTDPLGMEKEGRLAFPSGHTSLSFVLTIYACGYLIWVWHWRHPLPPKRLTFWQEFRADLVNVLAKAWMLGMLCFAWGVGISRIIDYQHDPSDVVGAALLGTMIALVYLLRGIPRWKRVTCCGGVGTNSRWGASSGDVEAPMVAQEAAGGVPKQRVQLTPASDA